MTLLASRYRILQELSSGAFGHTFLVEDTHLPSRRRCVLKQLKPIDNQAQFQAVKARFEREAAILEQLEHDQIPTLYAYFSDNEKFYLVQEWIKGQTLFERLRQRGPWSESEVYQLLMDVLPVLSYIHQKGIIHRDIKPDNLLIREQDGKPVLIDFGVVKETLRTDPQGNPLISIAAGTPEFMPLEQAAGKPVMSSDLFSLGITAIVLLTGKFPRDLTDKKTGDMNWHPYAPGVSPGMAMILDKATQSHFRDRYVTALEMLAALRLSTNAIPPVVSHTAETVDLKKPVADDVPVISKPVPPTERVPIPPAAADVVEIEFWNSIKTSANPESFEAYLEEYPSGKFARLAKIRLKELTPTLSPPPPVTNPSPIITVAPPSVIPQPPEIKPLEKVFTNSLGMKFVLIPAGSFEMGSNQYDDEKPIHTVTISQPFYLGQYQVTQQQWTAVMGSNPSHFKGDNLPVEQVSWNEVQEFIRKLNGKGDGDYRLPSEAEWEYACRAGTSGDYAGNLDEMGWYGDNSGRHRIDAVKIWETDQANYGKRLQDNSCQTHPVGQKSPNGWRLYDMHGNVWEWCQDRWHDNYNKAPTDGSAWESGSDNVRVLRGGSWDSLARNCRSAYRDRLTPGNRYHHSGFRVVCVPRTES